MFTETLFWERTGRSGSSKRAAAGLSLDGRRLMMAVIERLYFQADSEIDNL